MEKGFIKRIIQATEDLDTSVYLNSQSFNSACIRWLSDFSDALNNAVSIFENFTFKVTGTDFREKRLEQIHEDYLYRLSQYVEGVDLVFSRKSLQYAKIAIKLHGPKNLTKEVLESVDNAKEYLNKFAISLKKVNIFSQKLMTYAKENKIQSLPKYKYQFERLSLFEKINLDLVIKLLKEHSEI